MPEFRLASTVPSPKPSRALCGFDGIAVGHCELNLNCWTICQRVSRFFNFGSNPEKPEIRRGSHYFKWWTAANGELPRRGQSMTPEVFFEGQVFRVSVEDASNDGEQQAKHDSEIYSRVTLLHEVSRPQSSDQPISQSSNHESLNHGIRNQSITESPNQVINQSSRPPARRKRKQETYY